MTTTLTTEPREPAVERELLSWPARITLASLSAGAAVIHFAMVPPHAAEWLPLGIAFAISGWFQLVFAIAVIARPSPRWLKLNVLWNLVFIGAWAMSRTIGFPVGPEAFQAEAVSVVDGLCVGLEAILVLGAALLVVRPRLGERLSIPAFLGGAAVPALAVVALTTAALASPAGTHDHGHEGAAHSDDHSAMDHAGGDDHTMDHGASDHGATDHAAADAATGTPDHAADHGATDGGESASGADDHRHPDVPLAADGTGMDHDHSAESTTDASGGDVTHMDGSHMHMDCTAPVTADEQAAADRLVQETKAATAKYADFNQAIADGYTPITPPNTQLVHYGNLSYMTDGKLLDPDHVESLMYAFDKNRTPYFVGAMYLNDDASVAPPSPGGCLTQWHDHTNLCLAPGKGMVGVVKADGTCPAGSTNEQTAQMMHVWFIPLPGGPLTVEASPTDIRTGVVALKAGA